MITKLKKTGECSVHAVDQGRHKLFAGSEVIRLKSGAIGLHEIKCVRKSFLAKQDDSIDMSEIMLTCN